MDGPRRAEAAHFWSCCCFINTGDGRFSCLCTYGSVVRRYRVLGCPRQQRRRLPAERAVQEDRVDIRAREAPVLHVVTSDRFSIAHLGGENDGESGSASPALDDVYVGSPRPGVHEIHPGQCVLLPRSIGFRVRMPASLIRIESGDDTDESALGLNRGYEIIRQPYLHFDPRTP